MRWTNSGRSPAINASLFSQFMTVGSEDDIPVRNLVIDSPQIQAPLAPSTKVRGPTCYVFDSDIAAVRNREKRLFIFGRADYRDVFVESAARITEVCMEVTINGIQVVDGNERPNLTFMAIGSQNFAT